MDLVRWNSFGFGGGGRSVATTDDDEHAKPEAKPPGGANQAQDPERSGDRRLKLLVRARHFVPEGEVVGRLRPAIKAGLFLFIGGRN